MEPPSAGELEECPFCAGREDRTPPETLRLPDERDWQVRVVPNKYPAFEQHEIVVHTPDHRRSLADLTEAEVDLVGEAWRRRREAKPEGHLFACVNEGREAGASLPHSHSQLVWLPEAPPAVAQERDLAHLLEGEPVLEDDGVAVVCPAASRAPYELRIAPVEPEQDAFGSALLTPALRLLARSIERLRHLEGPVPLNARLRCGARR